jgi:carbamoyl-phosphate synthase large subunit
MTEIGLETPKSVYVNDLGQAKSVLAEIGLPAIIRPSFTLGGSGGSIAETAEDFDEKLKWGLHLSPRGEVLVEQSVLGWKEFELEVMRDCADNVVIICSIENFDPMGVHTGDSITVAPAQTLTDKEYQRMRDAAIAIIRKIGVDTGGSNIQFAVHPGTGAMTVIETNPRVSRSYALASRRRPASRSRRSRRSSPSATGSTSCATTSRGRHRPASSRRSTTSSPRSRVSPSRKFPQADPRLRRADEVGRRGDVDRAHLPRVAAEGHPFARDRPLRLPGVALSGGGLENKLRIPGPTGCG